MMFKTNKRTHGRVLAQAATGMLVMILGGLTVSQARAIRVDSAPSLGTCSSVTPIDSTAADFNPNVGVSVTSECNSTSGVDQMAGDPFETTDNAYSNANLYYWGGSFGDTSSTQAQVADYTLSSGDLFNGVDVGNLTEIEFNYPTCSAGISAEVTMAGVTYSAPCVTTDTTSLLFNADGTLFGVFDVDSNGNPALVNTLSGTGWSIGSTVTTSVPEPDTLALFGLAALPVLLLVRRRRGITNN